MTFNERVYILLKRVPKGKVTTYKIIAEKLNTKAYRAVGQAMKNNPYAPVVPCHRVVRSDGSIGGYQGKTGGEPVVKKAKMLQGEGIEIVNFKIIVLPKYLYKF